jgi:hypothetical protein
VTFFARTKVNVADFAVAFAEDPTCARIEPSCGDVELPARARLSFDGSAVHTLAVGESVVDPTDPGRTLFLAGARFRAAVAPSCASHTEPLFATKMFFAVVAKPVPGP